MKYEGIRYEVIALDNGPITAFKLFKEALEKRNLYFKSGSTSWERSATSLENIDKRHLEILDCIFSQTYAIGIPEEPEYRAYTHEYEVLKDHFNHGPWLKDKRNGACLPLIEACDECCWITRAGETREVSHENILEEYDWYNPITEKTHVCGVRV